MASIKKAKHPKMSREERLKLDIARRLGLLDKVRKEGWGALSAAEVGRIGGIMNAVKLQQAALKQERSDKGRNI